MERNFISDVTFDLETIRELDAHMAPAWRRWLFRGLAVFLMICVGWGMFAYPESLKFYAGLFFIAYALSYFSNKDGGAHYRKLLEENGGHPRRNMISITDRGIHYWNPETHNTADAAFSEVKAITRTRHFLVLGLADGSHRLIDHSNVTGGTAEELEAFLLERCGVERVRVRRDDSVIRRVLLWVMAIGFFWSFFGVYNGVAPEPKVMTYHEAAEVLKDLGIDAPEAEILDELEEYGASQWAVTDLLYYAGAGEYDYETWEWTPAQSGVYTFDAEVFNVAAMYTDFLHGVAAMSGGALEFTDITEDNSMIDPEAGTGFKTVTFTYDGRQHTLRPEVMSDWFDAQFANDIAGIIGKTGDGRRLYFLYDGYQMVSVFYCDARWAKEFAKATGYTLTTSFS